MGECNNRSSRIPVDTFAGRIHVEWDPNAEVTPFGQLPFFIEFLKASGLFESFVSNCPLRYPDAKSRKQMGYDMLVTVPDYEYRHRQRVFLSAKGEHIFKKLDRYFKVVDPLPSSDAFP